MLGGSSFAFNLETLYITYSRKNTCGHFVPIVMMNEHTFIKHKWLLHECGSRKTPSQKHRTEGAGGVLTM